LPEKTNGYLLPICAVTETTGKQIPCYAECLIVMPGKGNGSDANVHYLGSLLNTNLLPTLAPVSTEAPDPSPPPPLPSSPYTQRAAQPVSYRRWQ
jgi:hypothetical protein